MSDIFGLRVRDKHGDITVDTISRIGRFIWASSATSSSGSQVLDGSGGVADITGIKTAQFSIPLNFDYDDSSHNVTRSGTTISWTAYSANYNAGSCVILVFAYT